MDTYSIEFSSRDLSNTEMERFIEFIKERCQLKQVFWLSHTFIAVPNSFDALQQIKDHSCVVSLSKFASGDGYQNKWRVVYD